MTDDQPTCRGRTWTFKVLPRDGEYRLWFDPQSKRWEVAQLHGGGEPLKLVERQPRRSDQVESR